MENMVTSNCKTRIGKGERSAITDSTENLTGKQFKTTDLLRLPFLKYFSSSVNKWCP
jgi:hypothetical protein